MTGMLASPSRRTILTVLLGAAGTALVGPGCGFFAPPTIEEISRYLIGLVRHPQAAADIGRRYIQADPALGSLSAEQLTELILMEAGLGDAASRNAGPDEIGRVVKNRVRQDFADETVVTVDGWLLSRTEARLCALVYLQQKIES